MRFDRFASIAAQSAPRTKDANGDLIVDMSFASEIPYERWFGMEILDMSEGAARLDRLNDGASLLFNHDWNDLRGAHVPGSVRVDKDRVMRGSVRITSATQAGRDAIALVETNILTKTSVSYTINKLIEKTTKKNGDEVVTVQRELDGRLFERVVTRANEESPGDLAHFRRVLDSAAGQFERADNEPTQYLVVDWTPLENSLVTVPADASVGIGRSARTTTVDVTDDGKKTTAVITTEAIPAQKERATTPTAKTAKGVIMEDLKPAAAPVAEPQDKSAMEFEKDRQQAIRNIASMCGIDERVWGKWIRDGVSPAEASKQAIDVQASRKPEMSQAYVGMEPKEVRKYSLWRAIRAVQSGRWEDAQLELEASQEVSKRTGRANGRDSFFIPLDIQQRDLTVGTNSAGGYLRATDNVSFIELLRNRMVGYQMGARRLSGLVGNVTVPKQSGGATAYWLSTEATAITESQQTFGQLALTPRTVGAYTEISRLLQLQASPDAELIIMSDLAKQIAIAADLAILNGTGTEQPTGIIGTAGIGGVTGTSIAYAGVLEFQSDVAGNNALTPSCGYVTTPTVAALLMARVKFSSTASPLWDGSLLDANVCGFKGMATLQCPTGDILFGDFEQVVVGEWGVLEIALNDRANFPAGITGVRAMYTMDVGVRYAGAFSLATSVT
jgi:HK97 family phage major capsid protein